MSNKMKDRVLLVHYENGVKGIIRLDLDAKSMRGSSLAKLGLAGTINQLFDDPDSKKIWGQETNPKIKNGEVDCIWLFVTEEFYRDKCSIHEPNIRRVNSSIINKN